MAILDGDIIKLVTEFVVTGIGIMQNVFTWEYQGSDYTDAGLISALTTWAEDFFELAATYLPAGADTVNIYVDLLEYDETEGKWLTSRNIGVTSGTVTFTDVNDMLPAQSAPCLVAFTARPKCRGRKFIPMFCEDTQNASVIAAGPLADLGDMLTEYIATHVIETGKAVAPGIVSDKYAEFLPFLSGMVNAIIFTQRRRNIGAGE